MENTRGGGGSRGGKGSLNGVFHAGSQLAYTIAVDGEQL